MSHQLREGLVVLGCAVLISFCAGSAGANDSIAHLATGGLILGQTEDVEMRSEDLFISTQRIKVRYRFFNISDRDIKTLVAFPMPELKPTSDIENYALPSEREINFLEFKTTVDEQAVIAQVEQRAFALGLERTGLLKKHNVPLASHTPKAKEALDRLPSPIALEFIRLGIAGKQSHGVGLGMEEHLYPRWSLRTTYYWTQVFPAQTEVVVEHEYRPSVGAAVQTSVGLANGDAGLLDPEMKRKYCIDKGFIAAARRAHNRLQESDRYLGEQWIEYVLPTGANWAGPIKNFRLVVDKGAPENLVSFCASGVKRISPTRFEVRKTDYVPSRNLNVLILTPNEID
jgi:hypothetical protein